MNSNSFTATPFEPAFRLAPVRRPPALTDRPEDMPIIVTPRRLPPRRRQSIPGLELVFAAGTLAILAIFAARLVERGERVPVVERLAQKRVASGQVDSIEPVAPAHGRGQRGMPGRSRQSPVTVSTGPGALPVGPSSKAEESVEELIASGLKACSEGWFDAADDFGTEAMRLAPHDPRGHGIRVLTAYLRQYPALADEAIDRMNGAVEVDLGRRYGRAAFVDRHDDELVFMANGRHVRLSLKQFKAIDGARFQVARQFLENGHQAANDLILGAAHLVMQINEAGVYRPQADAGRDAARLRWQAAAQSSEKVVADHAQDLLALLEESADSVAMAAR